MPASEIAMVSRHTDRCEAVLLAWKGMIMVRKGARNGKGKLVAEMDLSNPEGFGLEVAQRGLNELSKHGTLKNGMME